MKRKGMESICKIAALFMAMALLVGCVNNVQAEEAIAGTDNRQTGNATGLFYVTKEGLYAHDLINDHTKQLHASPDISSKMYPLLASPDGNHIAYTAGDELYITSTGFGEVWTQPVCVLSVPRAKNNAMSTLLDVDINYAWADHDRLLYAKDGMIGLYDLQDGKAIDLPVDFRYENLTSGKEGIVYAKRTAIQDPELESGEKEITEIVQLNIDVFFAENENPGENVEDEATKVLLSGMPLSPEEGTLGKTYTITGISSDKTKLFLWPHTYSASLSADGTGEMIIYDLSALDGAKTQKPTDPITIVTLKGDGADEGGILMYADNIASNPTDSNLLALNTGYGREMWTNKQTQIFDIKSKDFTPVDFGCEVTMMPAWSTDGLLLACSGGKDEMALYMKRMTSESVSPEAETPDMGMSQIMARSIYVFNTQTRESERLTSVEGVCDFAPAFINDENNIVFARWDEKQANLALIKLAKEETLVGEAEEVVLAENIKCLTEGGVLFGFYGHIDSRPYFTVWQP